jgi:hypothetical protein
MKPEEVLQSVEGFSSLISQAPIHGFGVRREPGKES